jgi:hypothetical protein
VNNGEHPTTFVKEIFGNIGLKKKHASIFMLIINATNKKNNIITMHFIGSI